MVEVKAHGLAAAIVILEIDEPDNLEGRFIQKRDLVFLRKATNFI